MYGEKEPSTHLFNYYFKILQLYLCTKTFNLRSVPITNNESVFHLNTFYNHNPGLPYLRKMMPFVSYFKNKMAPQKRFKAQ